jgi:alpha-L-rhamnosidase
VTWAKGEYQSIRGRIAAGWKIENQMIYLDVTVPPNTTATVYVPTGDASAVRESGHIASEAEGVTRAGSDEGVAIYRLDAGQYHFAAPRGQSADRQGPVASP